MSHKYVESQVHVGKDGVLFLEGGRHSVFKLFSDSNAINKRSYETFWKNLKERYEYCSSNDIRYVHVIFPEKSVALKEYILGSVRSDIRSLYTHHYRKPYLAQEANSELNKHILYPLLDLRVSSGYLKTDTHLSGIGCLRIAKLIFDKFFGKIGDHELISSMLEGAGALVNVNPSFSGDLARMLHEETGTLVSECAHTNIPKPDLLRVETNGLLKGNDGIIDLLYSDSAITSHRLLVFGDSFMRQILPLMAFYFKEIIFARTRYCQYELVPAFTPSHIITSTAERYLSKVLSDNTRPHFLSYPLLKGVPTSPSEGFADLWSKFIDPSKLV